MTRRRAFAAAYLRPNPPWNPVSQDKVSRQHGVETHSAVERIAAFAAAARPEHLRLDIRTLYKRNILDSPRLRDRRSTWPTLPSTAEQFEEYRTPGRCTLIAGGKTSADHAALFNSGLVRYVDLLDSYMSPGGLCHPSDNFGAVLAAAEQVGPSGEEFLLALAVAYEIQSRFTAAVLVMVKGFNHATHSRCRQPQAQGNSSGSLRRNRRRDCDRDGGQLLARLCACRAGIAMEGVLTRNDPDACRLCCFDGQPRLHRPDGLVRRPKGLEQIFAQPIPVNWEDPSLELITQTVLKKYCSLIHGQPVLEATLDLRRSYGVEAAEVEHARCDIFQAGYDFAGGGARARRIIHGSKSRATTI